MFLRTVIVAILLMPMLFGMTNVVPRPEPAPERVAIAGLTVSDHNACADRHTLCGTDDCCEWGPCVSCIVLPVRSVPLAITAGHAAVLLPTFLPLRSGRSIRPAQEPPRRI